jgi:hypothetical protein
MAPLREDMDPFMNRGEVRKIRRQAASKTCGSDQND